jgi:hypothetical protein
MQKGLHTKKNVWDKAAALKIYRGGELIDRGVNYFVLMLDQMEMPTYYSCEGHPNDFYIIFKTTYEGALALKSAGYFTVEIERENYWSMRNHLNFRDAEREKVDAMRWAANAWEKQFGPLDFSQIAMSD